jgi:hypothetical protein
MRKFLALLIVALMPALASAQAINWGDYTDANQTIYVYFNTVGTDGVAETLASGALEIYEDGSATQITTAETLDNDFDSITGFHQVAIDLNDAGFEAGKTYTVILTAGTVDGVSIAGRTVGVFSVERTPKVNVTQFGGTNATTSGGRPEVNVSHWLGTAAATPTTAGVPEVDVTFWGGTAVASANVRANLMQINGTSLTPGTNGNDMADNFSTLFTNGDLATSATLDDLTTLKTRVGTPSNLGGGTSTLAANLVDIEAQTDDWTTAQSEPAQGAPAANATPLQKISYLYKAWRNKKTQTGSLLSIFADDATTVDHKATVGNSGGTTNVEEIVTGP